jgi:tetratricopeptide (TPR) repeat protein
MLHVARAEIMSACGRRTEAFRHLEAFCESEQGRGSAAARLTLADLYRANGDFQAAKAWVDQAESMAPGSLAVFAARVNLLASQKEFTAIPPLLADYRAKNPDRPVAVATAAEALLHSGDRQALLMARDIADELVVAFPNFIEGHIVRAEAARAAGELETAAAAYHSVLRLEPFHPRANNDLAWLLSEQLDKPREALEIADKAAARSPNDPHLLDTRGAILMRLGRFTDARRDLERCLELARTIPSTQAHAAIRLARVLNELKDAEAAKARLEQALQIDKQHRVLTEAERSEAAKLVGS